MYTGSHNSTAAAWGVCSKSRQKQDQLSISNWELGIVFPVELQQETDEGVFVPVPFQFPPPVYSLTDEPWMRSF
jgi:hypothetical protein